MLLSRILLVLGIAVVVGTLFSFGLRRRGRRPWPSAIWFFLILFVGTWALGGFFRPLGPAVGDLFWVPYLVAALLIAMLLATATPIRALSTGEEPRDGRRGATRVARGAGVLFWLVLAASLLLLAIQYAWFPAL
jgi:hypothetical protein